MKKSIMRAILLLTIAILFVPAGFSAELLSCEWNKDSYTQEERLFFANEEFTNIEGDSSGKVLSSPVAFQEDQNYNFPLSCSSPLSVDGDKLEFYESTQPNCKGNETLLHFTDDTNALASTQYNASKHSQTLCAKLPTTISSVDIVVSQDNNYDNIGYTCLFRTNSNRSGRISSCDAEFDNGNTYDYTVWARAFQSEGSLSCNSDCASSLDNRVRTACSQQVESCQEVPSMCDGSLVGSWVDYNSTHQINCEKPWNEYRTNPVDNSTSIQVDTSEAQCPNVISQDYSVILDNEPVKMKVYMCSD